jgi:hypothetical protein
VLEEVELPVRRRVQVPGEVSLAVQSVMGWNNSHLHEFDIDGRRYGIPDPDWGDQDVTDEAKSKLFRLVGQGARFRYLYDFGDNWAHRLTVEKIAAPEPGVRYPRCVSGRGGCPPEDVDVTVRHDDPDLGIDWPLPVSAISAKDRAGRPWAELSRLLSGTGGR